MQNKKCGGAGGPFLNEASLTQHIIYRFVANLLENRIRLNFCEIC